MTALQDHNVSYLLNVDQNPKTIKSRKLNYMTGVMYLAPHLRSGYQVCPMASVGCIAACLNTSGWGGRSDHVQEARVRRTKWFFEDRPTFMDQIAREIESMIQKANRQGMKPCIRLNGTSDIPWENTPYGDNPNLMAAFPNVQFYDYTKRHNRRDLPPNYHLTFSRSEENEVRALQAFDNGMNIAVVFKPQPPVGNTYMLLDREIEVVSGEETDLRFLDKSNSIVGLRARGKGLKDTSGFVVRLS